MPVPAATGAVSVSAGGAHTCAALENGAVLCWGRNTNGQLGLGVSSNTVEMPTPVPGLQDAIAVATAGARTCALLASGEAACWGDDDLGTLGIGVPLDRNAPTPVVSLVDAVQSDAGLYGTCALRANGRLVCWGQNDLLGRGGSNNALTPFEVFGVDDAVMVSAGGAEGPPTESHTCVLRRDGGVRCFGSHQKGQLGDGRDYGNNPIPVDVALDAVDAISLGARHSCALRAGRVLCWGDDSKGQIGGGGPRRSPVDVGISNVVDVAAGEETTCAVHVDGTVSCWGKEVYSGATQVPTEVSSITDAQAVTVGSAHVCVLHEDGRVSCWGDGTSWQLGNGTMDSSATPVQVQGLEDAIAISAGRVHTCALRETKTVVCWGWGAAGQLGHGATSASGVPVDVVGLTDVVAIGSGEYHTCAALESGEVFCWGRNNGGQIGQGARGGNSGGLPLKVVSLPQDVTAVAGGFQHTCAVRANGTTLCWGGSAQGQTGDGRPFTTVPLPVLWPMP